MVISFQMFGKKMVRYRLVFVAMALVFASLQTVAQEMMTLGKRQKVELEGEKLRPARAYLIAHSVCPSAGEHFATARRMRRWNFALGNVGAVEMAVGILAIERDQLAFGIATGFAGGIVEAIISSRNNRIKEELELGVNAYNHCMLWR